MSWYQLDPQSIATRVCTVAAPAAFPSLGQSLLTGTLGFTAVSIAGFAPWAVFGQWFYRTVGALPMYLVCAVVFIAFAGLLLHRLIIGPGSLPRFYKLFSIAFAAYSVIWIVAWMGLRGDAGSILGLLGGTAVMGWMIATAFDARGATVKIVAALFLLNTMGYYIGGWFEAAFIETSALMAKLLWGVWYGLGLGAGLGIAFYLAQEGARSLLRAPDASGR
jgi:hypothetical protein